MVPVGVRVFDHLASLTCHRRVHTRIYSSHVANKIILKQRDLDSGHVPPPTWCTHAVAHYSLQDVSREYVSVSHRCHGVAAKIKGRKVHPHRGVSSVLCCHKANYNACGTCMKHCVTPLNGSCNMQIATPLSMRFPEFPGPSKRSNNIQNV